MGLATFVLLAMGALILASVLLGPWALIVVLGGLLAYLGDTVAGYFGKRRLSLWGMRPKHTAIVISIATGVIITMLTLAAAALISEEYRVALTGVRRLQADAQKLRSDNATLVERSAALTKEYEERARQVEALSKVVVQKETGDVALPAKAPILPQPVLVNPSIRRDALSVVVRTMIEGIGAQMAKLSVTFVSPQPRDIDEKLVSELFTQTQGWARYLREHPEPGTTQLFIRPTSVKNINRREKLSTVNFDVQPNSVIVARGTPVAHTTVDGHRPDDVILAQLFNFDTHVQELLRDRGVLEESLENRLGRVPAAVLLDFVKVMEAIRGRQLTVTAVARDDIKAQGEISLAYRLSEGISPTPPADSAPPGRATSAPAGTSTEGPAGAGHRD